MSPQTKTTKEWTLASVALLDAYTDFVLSRQVMNCTTATVEFYKYGTGRFMTWVEQQGVTSPEQITARHVRQYLATLAERGLADTSLMGQLGLSGHSCAFGIVRGIYLPSSNLIDQDRLVSFFGKSPDTSEYQAKLFGWFCEQAGIDLPNLEKHFHRSRFDKKNGK